MVRKKKEKTKKELEIEDEIKECKLEHKNGIKPIKDDEKERRKYITSLFKHELKNAKKKKENWFNKDVSKTLWMPYDDNLKQTNKIINNTWFQSSINGQKIQTNDINLNLKHKTKEKKPKFQNKDKKNVPLDRVKIVQIKPNQKQTIILKKWLNAYRLTYNKTLSYVKSYYKKYNELPNLNETRTLMTNMINDNKDLCKNIRVTKIPSNTCDAAVYDVFKHYESCLLNKKNGHIKKFNIKFIKNKQKVKSLHLTPAVWSKDNKKDTFSSSVLGEHMEVLTKEVIHESKYNKQTNVYKDIKVIKPFSLIKLGVKAKLQYNSETKKFFLYIYKHRQPIDIKKTNNIISLDPGLRTFQTGYSDNSVVEFGTNMNQYIGRKLEKIYMLKSLIDNGNNKQQQLKRRVKYLQLKLKNKRKDLHNKVINYLCTNYKTIVIGKLSTSSTSRKGSNLSKLNKSVSYALSHYTFRERLNAKAKEYGNKVIETNEYMTSKYCGHCGKYNDIGTSKNYSCLCGLTIDRDYNGARNILIKTIVELNNK